LSLQTQRQAVFARLIKVTRETNINEKNKQKQKQAKTNKTKEKKKTTI
jgi:hypothetical protein